MGLSTSPSTVPETSTAATDKCYRSTTDLKMTNSPSQKTTPNQNNLPSLRSTSIRQKIQAGQRYEMACILGMLNKLKIFQLRTERICNRHLYIHRLLTKNG